MIKLVKIYKKKLINNALIALLFMPIFISVDNAFGLSLSRPGVYFEDVKYLFTVPLNLVLALMLIFFLGLFNINVKIIGQSKISPIALIYLSVILFLYVLALVINESRGVLIGSGLILLFICSQAFIRERVQVMSYMQIVNVGFLYMIIPGVLASLLLLISDSNLNLVNYPGEIFSNYFAIYNFEQYYAINLVLALGLMVNELKANFKKFFVYFLAVMFVSYVSENSTALIINSCLILVYLINKLLPKFYALFNIFYVAFSAIFFMLFPLISYLYIKFQYGQFIFPGGGFWDRIQLHNYYISNFKFINILLPAASEEWFINGRDAHHQFLIFLSTGGFLFALLLYAYITKILLRTRVEDRFIFASIIFIVGGMVEPLTHPYIMVQFFLFFMLSYVENKKRIHLISKQKFEEK